MRGILPTTGSSAGAYVLVYCWHQFNVFRESSPRQHLEIIYTRTALQGDWTLRRELGFPRMHGTEMFPEFSGTHSETGDDALPRSVLGCFDLMRGGFDVYGVS